MIRKHLVKAFSAVAICAAMLLVPVISASDDLIIEGDGVKGISVGVSTKADVIARFGEPDDTDMHAKYSTELVYSKLGMNFYYCQADPRKEIFVIELKKPFKGQTTKGIRIGESIWSEVNEAYTTANVERSDEVENEPTNDPDDGDDIEAKGITFSFKNTTRTKPDGMRGGAYVVDGIDIIENDGLRQCDSKFGALKDK